MLLDNLDDDFAWYSRDPEGYRSEQARRDEIVNKELMKFLGKEFNTVPLNTAKEVEDEIKNRSARLAALTALKAPQLLLDNEQRMLEESLAKFQKGDYAVTNADLEYRKQYWEKYEEFFRLESFRDQIEKCKEDSEEK